VPTTVPSTTRLPSTRVGPLAAERLAFFQIGCAAGATRFCFFFFFFVALLVVFRVGIALARLAFPIKKSSRLANHFLRLREACAAQTLREADVAMFQLLAQDRQTKARYGHTPAFMPIGTQDTVKTIRKDYFARPIVIPRIVERLVDIAKEDCWLSRCA
jgi:hypothetical protein